MSAFRDQVALAMRALAVTSATSYSWFGEPARPLPRAAADTLPPAAVRDYLLRRLTNELYRSFYVRGAPIPHHPRDVAPARSDAAFVAGLSAANAGAGGWESGWAVDAVGARSVSVARNGLRVSVPPSDCEPSPAATMVRLRRGNEQRSVAPGFYIALSDAEGVDAGDTELRVYLHVIAAGAAPLVATATRLLNDLDLAFTLKVLAHPANYGRCDAAVLYLRRPEFDRARQALGEIVSACAAYLRPEVPALTRPLAPGVAVAEHMTRDGGSFGSSRCGLLADGALRAHERGARAPAARVDAVAERFAARGLDIDKPYLAPGARDAYAL
jgi:hypothetical protein